MPSYRIPKKKLAEEPAPEPAPSPTPAPEPPERARWTSRPMGPVVLNRRAVKRQREQEVLLQEHDARAQERHGREAARLRAEEDAKLEAERREQAAAQRAEKRARLDARRAEESRRQFEVLEVERIRDLEEQIALMQGLVELCRY